MPLDRCGSYIGNNGYDYISSNSFSSPCHSIKQAKLHSNKSLPKTFEEHGFLAKGQVGCVLIALILFHMHQM
jgi:hypothetical protein